MCSSLGHVKWTAFDKISYLMAFRRGQSIFGNDLPIKCPPKGVQVLVRVLNAYSKHIIRRYIHIQIHSIEIEGFT